MTFETSDVVRVRRLLTPTRDVDGRSAHAPQPRLGDLVVVAVPVGDDRYLVEHRTDDGVVLWVAEFHGSELELVS
jgi:hypothetical protein